ncbi:hypothetical protein [Nocardiopsis synnemataformans]|uniref:hypothetical protein n=1 Tax=Nocardiopsis synnemataformans TaxID=61305 RepID=UPI003EBFFAE9
MAHPCPESFTALVEHVPSLRGVRFTGDRDATRDLDHLAGQDHSRWIIKAWAALLMLSTYTRAKHDGEWSGTFPGYCRQAVAGPVPRQTTLPRRQRPVPHARLLPVPLSVSVTGQALMSERISISTHGVGPCLYYLDRTFDGDGVIVGWIGRDPTRTRI